MSQTEYTYCLSLFLWALLREIKWLVDLSHRPAADAGCVTWQRASRAVFCLGCDSVKNKQTTRLLLVSWYPTASLWYPTGWNDSNEYSSLIRFRFRFRLGPKIFGPSRCHPELNYLFMKSRNVFTSRDIVYFLFQMFTAVIKFPL